MFQPFNAFFNRRVGAEQGVDGAFSEGVVNVEGFGGGVLALHGAGVGVKFLEGRNHAFGVAGELDGGGVGEVFTFA